jgi:hypothetical protein
MTHLMGNRSAHNVIAGVSNASSPHVENPFIRIKDNLIELHRAVQIPQKGRG